MLQMTTQDNPMKYGKQYHEENHPDDSEDIMEIQRIFFGYEILESYPGLFKEFQQMCKAREK